MSMTSPREAAPGPGYWTVTDLDSRLLVNRARLEVSGASADWDRTMFLMQTSFLRHRGRYVEFNFTPDIANGRMACGWQNAASAVRMSHECAVFFDSDGFVKVADGGAVSVNTRYPYLANTTYIVRVYDGGSPLNKVNPGGDFYAYIRTADVDEWTLLWRKTASVASLRELYAGFNDYDLTGSFDWVRVRSSSMLPVWGYVSLPVSGQAICSAADGIVEVLVEAPTTGTVTLTFRGDGGSNFWSLVMDMDNESLDLYKTVAGVATRVQSKAVNFQPLRQYLLRAVTFGSHIRCFAGRTEGPSADDLFSSDGIVSSVSAQASVNLYNLRNDAGGELLW